MVKSSKTADATSENPSPEETEYVMIHQGVGGNGIKTKDGSVRILGGWRGCLTLSPNQTLVFGGNAGKGWGFEQNP